MNVVLPCQLPAGQKPVSGQEIDMGETPKAEGRTRSKARKRKAQKRPATAEGAAAAAADRAKPMAKRRQKAREDTATLALARTPKKSARVRGRSSDKSSRPETAKRGR
jgi:hypothetical protein